MKLYVGNLSYLTTEDTLKTLFSNYADVASVEIMRDRFTQQSKGFGFVEIEDEIKAQRAIGGMNGKDVDGRRIRVSEAVEKPRRERRDFGGYGRSEDFSGGFRRERGNYDRRDEDDRGRRNFRSSDEYGRKSNYERRDFSDGGRGYDRDFSRGESRGYGRRDGRYDSDRRNYGRRDERRGRSYGSGRYGDNFRREERRDNSDEY